MKRFINYFKYTKSIWFMCRVLIAWLFTKIWFSLWMNSKIWASLLKVANYFCSKEYIFNTPFWKYLTSSLQEYILMDNDYEPDIYKTIKNVENKLKSKQENTDKYLINIWANIWRWTIDLAKNFWYKVIAIEPAPHTYYSLRVNIALSDLLDKIETYNVALWNENTNLRFEYRKYHNGSSHIIDENDITIAWWEIIEVPVKKFDDLQINKEKIKATRLIVMDVEWFELNVIKWMQKTLSEFENINIIMEIWEDKKNKENTINFMENLWYSAKKIDNSDWLFSK